VIRHIAPYFGNIPLQSLTPEQLQKFVNYKLENGRLDGKESGISPKTIINMKNMIHAAFKQAEINGLVSRNVATLIKSPKQEKVEMRVLTNKEFFRLLAAAENDRDGAPIILALYTGMRVDEIMTLKVFDIDLDDEKPELYVRTSMKRDYLNASHDKKAEIIALSSGKTALVRSTPSNKKLYK
jgi:integrase